MLAGEARSLSDVLEPGLLKLMEAGRFHAICLHTRSEDQATLLLLAQQNVPQTDLPVHESVPLNSYLTDWLEQLQPTLAHHDLAAATISRGTATARLSIVSRRAAARARRVLGLLSCYRVTAEGISPYRYHWWPLWPNNSRGHREPPVQQSRRNGDRCRAAAPGA